MGDFLNRRTTKKKRIFILVQLVRLVAVTYTAVVEIVSDIIGVAENESVRFILFVKTWRIVSK